VGMLPNAFMAIAELKRQFIRQPLHTKGSEYDTKYIQFALF
jgi:hypothetical protein